MFGALYLMSVLYAEPIPEPERTGWDDFKEGMKTPLAIAATLVILGVAALLVMAV